jgi:hypothetical protein
MNAIIDVIARKCDQLTQESDELLRTLEVIGWPDKRPERTHESRLLSREEWISMQGYDPEEEFPELRGTIVPATARIPTAFIQQYHRWYAGCLGLVEANMPPRREELVRMHEAAKKNPSDTPPMLALLQQHMSFKDQIAMAQNISHIAAIVTSIPHYMHSRLHDVELAVAQAYVGDQLNEAQVLIKGGHIRAAGAVAGVLLERHLKLLCDRHTPTITYPKNSAISKLNDLLRDAAVYDVSQWRKIQWMADIRNQCDHAGRADPKKEDVSELIVQIKKFVALFIF